MRQTGRIGRRIATAVALTSAPEGSRVPMGARRAVPAAKASGRYRFGEGTFPSIPGNDGEAPLAVIGAVFAAGDNIMSERSAKAATRGMFSPFDFFTVWSARREMSRRDER